MLFTVTIYLDDRHAVAPADDTRPGGHGAHSGVLPLMLHVLGAHGAPVAGFACSSRSGKRDRTTAEGAVMGSVCYGVARGFVYIRESTM